MKFFEPGQTRVILLGYGDIADISAPTVAELNTGLDISAALDRGGAEITHDTETMDRSLWYSNQMVEAPTRFSTKITLRAYRHHTAGTNTLWQDLTFRARRIIVRRLGPGTGAAFSVGQRVEVYKVRAGKRQMVTGAGNEASMWSVPLFSQEEDDDAVIA